MAASCHMRSSTETTIRGSDASAPRAGDLEERLIQLPPYTRSLLRIEVPISVTLASARVSLQDVLQLAPGTVIPLAKSCAQPLLLSVSNYDVAVGEPVKIGDKFGLRIISMLMPRERYYRLSAGPKSEQ